MNACTSEDEEISYGVPQRSVLGPKLFLMFINDLVLNILHCKFFLYADDIVMFKSIGKDSANADIDLFKRDLAAIEFWCLKNELTINIKKNKLQFFPEIKILIVAYLKMMRSVKSIIKHWSMKVL